MGGIQVDGVINLGQKRIVIPKNFAPLVPGGWEVWKMRLEGLLKAEGLENILLDCDPAPTDRENAYGIHMLNSLISDEYLPYVRKCTTGREAYLALEQMHMGDNITKYSTLLEKLLTLEKKSFTIDQYIHYTSDLQRDLVGAGERHCQSKHSVWHY